MLFRNKQALFWALTFPLIFTCIFGFFFGKQQSIGTIDVINNSTNQIAQSYETALADSKLFSINKVTDLAAAKNSLSKSEIVAVVVIDSTFGDLTNPNSSKSIQLVEDPANSQVNSALVGFTNSFLTSLNFNVQKVQPIFTINEEKINTRELNYFDFVMAGILGLALMNASIIGVAVNMTKYREDQILKRITTTPLASWKFILAELLSRLTINMVQITLILSVGIFIFGGHVYGNIVLVYLLAILGAILFQLIGFVVASFSKTTDAAQGLATVATIPMMFLSGVFFPIDQLPAWLSMFVQYLPLAPLLRMIRNVTLDAISPLQNPQNMILVVSWIVICLVISVWRFRLAKE